MAYSQKQLKELESRLLRERERALRALARFDDDFGAGAGDAGDLFAFPLHMADEGTDANQREKAFLLASKDGRRVLAIDAALRRLYRDPRSFGRCPCGADVGMARLDAIPWAETCITCQNQRETAE